MNGSAGSTETSMRPSALGLSFVEAGHSTKKIASSIVETFLADFSNVVLSSFAQLRTSVHGRPLYVMMEPTLGCDPAHDHEAPKDILPLFLPYINKAETQILTLPTSVLRLKLEEMIIELLKNMSEENLDLQRQLDNVRTLLEDSHLQVNSRESLMSSMLKSKSDEKTRLLTEIQQLREQLYQKRIHGGVNIYKPDFGYMEKGGYGDNDEESREFWTARIKEKDDEILHLNRQILAQSEELATLKSLAKDSLDETERKKLEALMKDKTTMDLVNENSALRDQAEALQRQLDDSFGTTKAELDALRAENAELNQLTSQQKADLEDLNGRLEVVNTRVRTFEAQMEEDKQRHMQDCEMLRKELEKANAAASAAKENLKKQALAADRLKAEMDVLIKDRDSNTLVASLQQQLEKQQKDNAKLVSDIKIYRGKLANTNAKIARITGKPTLSRKITGYGSDGDADDYSDISISDQDNAATTDSNLATSHTNKDASTPNEGAGPDQETSEEDAHAAPVVTDAKMAALITKYREIVCFMARIPDSKLPKTLGGLAKFLNGRKKKEETVPDDGTCNDSTDFIDGNKAGGKGTGKGGAKGGKGKPGRGGKEYKSGPAAKCGAAGKNVAQARTPAKRGSKSRNERDTSQDDNYSYYSYSISSNDTYLIEDRIDDDFFGVGGDPDAMVRRGDVEEYVSMKIQAALENFRFEYENEAEIKAMGIAREVARTMLENCSHRSCQTYISYITDTMRTLTDAEVIDENDGLYLDERGNWRRIGDVAVKYGQGPDDLDLNKRRLDLYNYTSQTDLQFDDPNHPLHRRDAQLAMAAANRVMNTQAMETGYRLNGDADDGLTTNQVFDRLYYDTQRMRNEANARREKVDSVALQYLRTKDTPGIYREVAQTETKVGLFGSLIVKSSAVPEAVGSPKIGQLNIQADKKTPGNGPASSAYPKDSTDRQKSRERVVQSINNVMGMNVASVKMEQPPEVVKPKKPMLVQPRYNSKPQRGTGTKDKRSYQPDQGPDSSRSTTQTEDQIPPSGAISPHNLNIFTEDIAQITSSAHINHNSEPMPPLSRGATPRMFQLVNNTDADGAYVRMNKEGIVNGQIIVTDGYVTNISYKNTDGDTIDRIVYAASGSKSGNRVPSSPVPHNRGSIVITSKTSLDNVALSSPDITLHVKQQQLPEYNSDQNLTVQPDMLIDTVIETGNSDLIRTTGEDSIRPSVDLFQTPQKQAMFNTIGAESFQKQSMASVVGLESISEAQKLSISLSSGQEHVEQNLPEMFVPEKVQEDNSPTPKRSPNSFVVGTTEQIHVTDADEYIGKNVIDLQKTAMMEHGGAGATYSPLAQSTLSGIQAQDDDLLQVLALLPVVASEDEFLTAPRVKSRYKSQRERDLLEPGASLQLIKVRSGNNNERLIEIITKPGDTPYFYDPMTEHKYADVKSLQECLQQSSGEANQAVHFRGSGIDANDSINFVETFATGQTDLSAVTESDDNSKISLQFEANGPEISIKSLTDGAGGQIRQLFKLTVDKHGRPRRLTEAELDLLSRIKNRKINSNATIRLQRGYPGAQQQFQVSKVSINDHAPPDMQSADHHSLATTTGMLRGDMVAAMPHPSAEIELSPEEVATLYFKQLDEKRTNSLSKTVLGSSLQNRQLKITPQVSTIPIKGKLEDTQKEVLLGRYCSPDEKAIEYVEDDQFLTELDTIEYSLMNPAASVASAADGSTLNDAAGAGAVAAAQNKQAKSSTADLATVSKLQSIRHIRDQFLRGQIKVVRADDGSRMFMNSRGFVINGTHIDDLLKEEPDKLCTQLDILTSLASSDLQAHGMLDGIKVRSRNGVIEADLLLPRMPIQTTKETVVGARNKSDPLMTTMQSITTTDSLFNSSYNMSMSLNTAKTQESPPDNSLASVSITTFNEDGHIGVQVPQVFSFQRASTSGNHPGHVLTRNSTRGIVRSQLSVSSTVGAAVHVRESPRQLLKPLQRIDGGAPDSAQQASSVPGRIASLQRMSGDYRDSEGLRFIRSSVPSLFVRSSKGSLADDSETNLYVRGGVISHGVAEILSYSKQNSHMLQPGVVAREVGLPSITPQAAHAVEDVIVCRGISFKAPQDNSLSQVLSNTGSEPKRPEKAMDLFKEPGKHWLESRCDENDTKLLTCSVRTDSPISPAKSYRHTANSATGHHVRIETTPIVENIPPVIDEVSDLQL